MAEVLEKITAVKRISEIYDTNLATIGEGLPGWVNQTRQPALQAFQRALECGLPTAETQEAKTATVGS